MHSVPHALPNDLGQYGVGPMSAGTSNAVALAILTMLDSTGRRQRVRGGP